MSAPYVYSPSHPPAELYPNYSHLPHRSPFIPELPLHSPYNSHPNTPHLASAGLPGNPHDNAYVQSPAASSWWNPPPRERRVSWQGATSPPPASVEGVTHLSQLSAPQNYEYYRRHSFGDHSAPLHQVYSPPSSQFSSYPYSPYPANYPPSSPYPSNYPPSPYPAAYSPSPYSNPTFFPRLHPFLDGTAPRPDFLFDLSKSTFEPLHLYAPGQAIPFAPDNFREPAAHPPVSHLLIVCDLIPQWPIEIPLPSQGNPSTLGLGDVLYGIQASLHIRIVREDFEALSPMDQRAVTQTFQRRCLARGGGAYEHAERMQGVKRVDFLRGRVWFKGLVPAGDVLKLIVA